MDSIRTPLPIVPIAPDSDEDLGDNPRTWRVDIGNASARLPNWLNSEEDQHISVRIGCSNHGIDLGIYTFTREETIDLIANLADALQEYLCMCTKSSTPTKERPCAPIP